MPAARSVVLAEVRAECLGRAAVLVLLMRPGETPTPLNAPDAYLINPGAATIIIITTLIIAILHLHLCKAFVSA